MGTCARSRSSDSASAFADPSCMVASCSSRPRGPRRRRRNTWRRARRSAIPTCRGSGPTPRSPRWSARPDAASSVVSAEKPRAIEAQRPAIGERGQRADRPRCRRAAAAGADVRGYNSFWIDPGTQARRGEGRDPHLAGSSTRRAAACRIPRPGCKRDAARRRRAHFDGPEARPLGERCIVGFGSTSGPPMLNVLYNNHYQIVQSPGHVVILVEMNHDARIIRLGGTHPPGHVRPWMGDSIGRWEGDTLVVETTNMHPGQSFARRHRAIACTSPPERESDRALHARRRRRDPLRVHGRGPERLHADLARRDAVARGRGADVRIRLPRGQPFAAGQHPARRAVRGEEAVRQRVRDRTLRRRSLSCLPPCGDARPPRRAHHAFAAEFDANAPVLLKGKVAGSSGSTRTPGCTCRREDDGKTQVWMVEGGTPEHAAARRHQARHAEDRHRDRRARLSEQGQGCTPACKANGRD